MARPIPNDNSPAAASAPTLAKAVVDSRNSPVDNAHRDLGAPPSAFRDNPASPRLGSVKSCSVARPRPLQEKQSLALLALTPVRDPMARVGSPRPAPPTNSHTDEPLAE